MAFSTDACTVLPPLTVAAVQPPCSTQDVPANAQRHAEAVLAAQARLVVFPELSLTGYELEAEAVSPGDARLAPIVEACSANRTVALVGAPVHQGPNQHIAMLRISASGVEVVYCKSWLGPAETKRFRPGPGPTAIEVDGWRLGLGICKDTGVVDHVCGTAELGIDVYVAGLAYLPEERAEHDARAICIARQCDAHVVFSSFAGSTGGGYDRTAGCSTIWSPAGAVLARASPEPGSMARAVVS